MAKEWKYWLRPVNNFIAECGNGAPDKYGTIINLFTHNVFDYEEDCVDLDSVVKTLQNLYLKTPNEIFVRHLFANIRQQSGESLDEFIQQLRKLSKDCNIKDVIADQYREERVCAPFINCLSLPLICQRLLENTTLSLEQTYTQANYLDLAQKNTDDYVQPIAHVATVAPVSASDDNTYPCSTAPDASALTAVYPKRNCCFGGGAPHNRLKCPDRESVCHNCEIK